MRFVYDVETYPNVFTFTAVAVEGELFFQFAISDYDDDRRELFAFLKFLVENDAEMVGFNNINFDYVLIHQFILSGGALTAGQLYNLAMVLIKGTREQKWKFSVWPSDSFIKQIDLFTIHHFNNKSRATSLKKLEFNMRSQSIEDLPFEVGTRLNYNQQCVLFNYNKTDCLETLKFYHESKEKLKLREELTTEYGRDMMSYSDVKIGTTIFELELKAANIPCYYYENNERRPIQTRRKSIALGECLLPYLNLKDTPFEGIHEFFKNKIIKNTKGEINDLTLTVGDTHYKFGTGGIHGSVLSSVWNRDDVFEIVDIDVKSYYPRLAITNGLYPEHLGPRFVDVYTGLYNRRAMYAKGTGFNEAIKLALNGAYGQSNAEHSFFHDPKFLLQITLNGQLLLCMLISWIIEQEPNATILQANTDGITVHIRSDRRHVIEECVERWCDMTKLVMEYAHYQEMYIRDVNSYLGIFTNGEIKAKGAYVTNPEWHQDHSALVIPKAAQQILRYGGKIDETVMNWSDIMDFMILAKVNRSTTLNYVIDGVDHPIQGTNRVIVTRNGGELVKLMPPTEKMIEEGKTSNRRIGMLKDRFVTVANDLSCMDTFDIDYSYYIDGVEKLVLGLC